MYQYMASALLYVLAYVYLAPVRHCLWSHLFGIMDEAVVVKLSLSEWIRKIAGSKNVTKNS